MRSTWCGLSWVMLMAGAGCARGDGETGSRGVYGSFDDDIAAEADAGADGGEDSDADGPYAQGTDAATSGSDASTGASGSGNQAAGEEPAENPDVAEFPVDPKLACAALSSCYQARYVGELSGDESGAPLVATGTRSEWVTVRVREDSGLARGLDVVLELKGEVGANYDLFVYRPDDASSMQCTGEAQASAQPGDRPESLSLSWRDRYLGRDDTRTLSVEIRHVDGDCKPWVLSVYRP